jgi:hypothetical protein
MWRVCGGSPLPPHTRSFRGDPLDGLLDDPLGLVCSHGFAQALAIYQKAGMVVVSGSATGTALPAAGPTVFNRTIVDDNTFDSWYPVISQLPVDLAWRLDYTVKFGSPPVRLR